MKVIVAITGASGAIYARQVLETLLKDKSVELYDKAEEAVKNNEEILRHVKLARMPLYFAGVKLGYGTKAERYAMLSQFSKLSIENNVDMVWEIGRDTAMQFIRTSMAELAD